MNDHPIAATSDETKGIREKRTRFSVAKKSLAVVLIIIGPLLLLALLLGYLSWSPDFSGLTSGIIAERIMLGGSALHLYYLFVILLAILFGYIGFSKLDSYFVKPLRYLLAWLSQARDTGFENVAVMPAFPADEIGEIGRILASSAAYFSETKDRNKALAEEKALFMTIAAHQLRTPLTGLLWSIEELLDPAAAPESKQKTMTDVDALLKRMRLIVNHILASVDAEGGRFGYVFEKIDIVPVIEALVAEFKPVSDSRGVSLSFEHGDEAFPVYADRERISLALFDLISNAIDYTPRGGSITVSAVPRGEKLEVAVADTGIGISETELPSLFRKFYRSDRARHMRPDGSGLGLFLLKNIINSHGSDIAVSSKEGAGSRFSFSLDSLVKPTGRR